MREDLRHLTNDAGRTAVCGVGDWPLTTGIEAKVTCRACLEAEAGESTASSGSPKTPEVESHEKKLVDAMRYAASWRAHLAMAGEGAALPRSMELVILADEVLRLRGLIELSRKNQSERMMLHEIQRLHEERDELKARIEASLSAAEADGVI